MDAGTHDEGSKSGMFARIWHTPLLAACMSDARFARLRTDPRFRKLKKQQKKLTVDSRFKSLLEDDAQDKKKSKRARSLAVDQSGLL